MHTDHRNICRFSDAKDPGYILVKNKIVELVEMAPDILKSGMYYVTLQLVLQV